MNAVKRSAPGREIAGAAKLRSIEGYQTFGTSQLCVWRDAPGICRFQTRNPAFARKLTQRSKARLVAWAVSGGYLRLFEERIKPSRGGNLVGRYLVPANGACFAKPLHRDTAEGRGRVKTAAELKRGRS